MSTQKSYSEELKSFKQYNKTARETRAKKLGYASAAAYISYLEACIAGKKTGVSAGHPSMKGNTVPPVPAGDPLSQPTPPPSVDNNVTIHVADVLDASGSMEGGKFNNALKGINLGIKELKSSKTPVKHTYTLCDFSDDIVFHYIKGPLDSVETIKGKTRGSTALYDAIGTTIEKVGDIDGTGVKPGDKVLVNIYTDGQENASRRFNVGQIATKIKALSECGWTFTFVGTQQDVAYVTRNLHIHESNTLVYDGTAVGLERSMIKTMSARQSYSESASRGEDVSKGFYKDVK